MVSGYRGCMVVVAGGDSGGRKIDIPCLRNADVVERLVLVTKSRETNTDDHLDDSLINVRK